MDRSNSLMFTFCSTLALMPSFGVLDTEGTVHVVIRFRLIAVKLGGGYLILPLMGISLHRTLLFLMKWNSRTHMNILVLKMIVIVKI